MYVKFGNADFHSAKFHIIFLMAPKPKQARHFHNIARNRSLKEKPVVQPNSKLDKDLMAVNGLLTGKGYCGMKRQANLLNTPTPSKRTYYIAQQKVGEKVVEIVKNDCKKYANQIKEGAQLSTDGRWNHPRNGSSATVTVFDNEQNKIVAYETMVKNKGIFAGNYQGCSGNMETQGVTKAFESLETAIKGKTVGIIHDHDNKTHGVIKRMQNKNINEKLDPGHAVQEIRRKANNYFEDFSRDLRDKANQERNTYKKCFEIFEILISKIVIWFKFLIFNVALESLREKMWLNMTEHVTGNHKNCVHPENLKGLKKVGRPKKKQQKNPFWVWNEAVDDDQLKKSLDGFLEKNKNLVKNTGIVRTQHNESTNAMITQVMPKNRVFNTSNEARVSVAIGRKNNPMFDSELIQRICPNALSPVILNEIRKDEKNKRDESINRSTRSFKKKKNDARIAVRARNKSSSSSDYKPK